MYIMVGETPEDVRKWFLKEVEKLWPLAGGSLSLDRVHIATAYLNQQFLKLLTVLDCNLSLLNQFIGNI